MTVWLLPAMRSIKKTKTWQKSVFSDYFCLHGFEAIRIMRFFIAGVAQLVEQLICNQRVVGSSPISGSMNIKASAFLVLGLFLWVIAESCFRFKLGSTRPAPPVKTYPSVASAISDLASKYDRGDNYVLYG